MDRADPLLGVARMGCRQRGEKAAARPPPDQMGEGRDQRGRAWYRLGRAALIDARSQDGRDSFVKLCALDASDLAEISLLTSPADPLLSREMTLRLRLSRRHTQGLVYR